MAVIARVYTIARAAELLGENEDRLHDIAVDMFPEDGCLWVLDTGERETIAFTAYGIDCLKEIIAGLRATGQAPQPKAKP